jgi:hypothetical protein
MRRRPLRRTNSFIELQKKRKKEEDLFIRNVVRKDLSLYVISSYLFGRYCQLAIKLKVLRDWMNEKQKNLFLERISISPEILSHCIWLYFRF